MPEEPTKRGTDLGMLTLTKLALIVTATLGASSVINNAMLDKKMLDFELRVMSRFATRESVVDPITYKADNREQDQRLVRLESEFAAMKVRVDAAETVAKSRGR